ncbi:hypothetical protein H4217_001769 [Coemansia sp. RSA 1939]|nr:hypothetical protein H4217_001769 [Coemansia sp. RSA 1939]
MSSSHTGNNQTPFDRAADGSSGSSFNQIDFASPSPPSSANISSTSSGHLPENVHLSLPAMTAAATAESASGRRQAGENNPMYSADASTAADAESADAGRGQTRSADRSRASLPLHRISYQRTGGSAQAAAMPPQESAAVDETRRRRILAAYNNQFAHLLGKPPASASSASGSGSSPPMSLISGSSFNSPRTITLDDLMRASRQTPRAATAAAAASPAPKATQALPREAEPSASSSTTTAKGKWSPQTPARQPPANDDRDSGLFGGQAFTFTSPTNLNTSSGSFGPIREQADEDEEDEGLEADPGRAAAAGRASSARAPSAQGSSRPRKFDVHVPPPESLARTPTLATRSPTPTAMLQQQPGGSGRRRAATTASSAGADSGIRASSSLAGSAAAEALADDARSRSRSFGGGSRSRSSASSASRLGPPLMPPPPEESAQFRNPFLGSDWPPAQSHEALPDYLQDADDGVGADSDHESATHTRIRRRKHRNPSSVASSAMSPAYTVNSAYSASNAGSNLTYELTYLGMHRTADSPAPPHPPSHGDAGAAAASAAAARRRRSVSLASGSARRHDSYAAAPIAAARPSAAPASIDDEGVMTASPSSGSEASAGAGGSGSSRRQTRRHVRSESAGSSSRVSSIRDEFEELARQHAAGARPTTPVPPLPASVVAAIAAASAADGASGRAMTPKSTKVARIRERIEEWQQRTEATEGMAAALGHSSSSSSSGGGGGGGGHSRPGSSATSTAMGAQIDIGEIEAVQSTATGASGHSQMLRQTAESQHSHVAATSSSTPRLVPLTPAAASTQQQQRQQQKGSVPSASSSKGKEPAVPAPLGAGGPANYAERVQKSLLDRNNTRASRDSKYSEDTAQSSNIPPSLYGSDKSVFNTPLLTGLPYVSVPSDIASLRTPHVGTATLSAGRGGRAGGSVGEESRASFADEVPTESSSNSGGGVGASAAAPMSLQDAAGRERTRGRVTGASSNSGSGSTTSSVLGAVASPVSIGGRKKQPLVVDALSASSEVLQGMQEVRVVSPEIHRVPVRVSASKASRVSSGSNPRPFSMGEPGPSAAAAAALRKSTKDVLESPAVDVPSATSAGERRAWAHRRPDDRPPLTAAAAAAGGGGSDSSIDTQHWDQRMRRRAETATTATSTPATATAPTATARDNLLFNPRVAESPALAVEPKSSGGVGEAIGSKYRIDRIDSALATLEGAPRQRKGSRAGGTAGTGTGTGGSGRSHKQRHRKPRQNRDSGSAGLGSPAAKAASVSASSLSSGVAEATAPPLVFGQQRLLQQQQQQQQQQGSVSSSQSLPFSLASEGAGDYQADPVFTAGAISASSSSSGGNNSRPLSQQRMGRHGSSPLNPFTGAPIVPVVAGSIAPPLPHEAAVSNDTARHGGGILQRITSTVRRNKRAPIPAASEAVAGASSAAAVRIAPTPLPRRWWRNIKESIYAPIPPVHSGQNQVSNQNQVPNQSRIRPPQMQHAATSYAQNQHAADALSPRPLRRHSFSGSTDIEQHRITAALSPRENVRRKATMMDRVRGMLRGGRQRAPQGIEQQPVQQPVQHRPLPPSSDPSSFVAGVAAPPLALNPAEVHSGGYSLKVPQSIYSQQQQQLPQQLPQSNWASTNPFLGALTPVRRRASFDTLSVHEMAEVDRQEMHSRLNNLISPHIGAGSAHPLAPAAAAAGAGAAAAALGGAIAGQQHSESLHHNTTPSLAVSPRLPSGSAHLATAPPAPGSVASSGFSFEAPSTIGSAGSSKPLPVAPKRRSHATSGAGSPAGVFTFSQQLPQPELAHHSSAKFASPIFGAPSESAGNDRPQTQTSGSLHSMAPAAAGAAGAAGGFTKSAVEMAERPRPVKPLPQKPVSLHQQPSTGTAPSTVSGPVAAPHAADVGGRIGDTSHDIAVNTTTFVPPAVVSDVKTKPDIIGSMEAVSLPQPVRQRPSLFKRLTAGWRRPDASSSRPDAPSGGALEPISEEKEQGGGGGGGGGGGALMQGALEATGAAVATGMLGKLFRPSEQQGAGQHPQQHQQPQQNAPAPPPLVASRTDPTMMMAGAGVPHVNVVTSPTTTAPSHHPNMASQPSIAPNAFGAGPQPYPPPATISHAQMSGLPLTQQQQMQLQQQQQQHSSGSTYPTVSAGFPQQQLHPLNGSTTVYTPMPGQTFPGNASLTPMQIQQQQQLMQQQQQQQMQMQMQQHPMSAPPTQFQLQQQQQGMPYGSAPPQLQQGMVQPSGGSKLAATLASIPIVGSLFGNAKKKQQQQQQQQQMHPGGTAPGNSYPYGGGRPSRPTSSSYFTRPSSSYTTSSAMNYHHGHQASGNPNNNNNGGGGIGALFTRLKDSLSWYHIPLITYLFRQGTLAEMRPLIGRYALQYPLVEATETAASRTAAKLAAQQGAAAAGGGALVRAGGLRAAEAKEFRHAAAGLRHSTLDNRLETTFVPKFSRLPKYRRAAEVWDDEEALQIAQRVSDRMNGTKQSPFFGNAASLTGQQQPRLRGGGGGGGREGNRFGTSRFAHVRDPYMRDSTISARDPYSRPRDVEMGAPAMATSPEISGHQGSGERGIAEGAGPSSMLADRIGAYIAGLFGKNRAATIGSASGRRQMQQPPSRVSASGYGLSRIEDDDADAGDNESELRSLRREPSVDAGFYSNTRDRGGPGGYGPDQGRPRGLLGGIRQRLFGTDQQQQQQLPTQQPQPKEEQVPTATAAAVAVAAEALDAHDQTDQRIHPPTPVPVAPAEPDAQAALLATPPMPVPPPDDYPLTQRARDAASPRMFPPFSHLPSRLVDHLMHRVGEPRVSIGLDPHLQPNSIDGIINGNSAEAGSQEAAADDDGSNPYRTGTEWNFAESVRFSSPYPTAARQVRNRRALSQAAAAPNAGSSSSSRRVLIFRPRSSEIARWIPHIENMRDLCQYLVLVLGACGFLRTPPDSTVWQRWPWMVVTGVPATLGLMWPELSTTTGVSVGMFVFFAVATTFVLLLWSYGLYVERPALAKAAAAAAESARKKDEMTVVVSGSAEQEQLVTYQEEVVVEPSRLDFVGRMFRHMPRRRRMHILYSALATLYIPTIKLCLDALVWGQAYWAVPNPYRSTDRPDFASQDTESGHRRPGDFCYTTTMRNTAFNGAFVILPCAAVLLLWLGVALPIQVHKLVRHSIPRVPGWMDGSSPGHRLPPAEAAPATAPAAVPTTAPAPAAAPADGGRAVRNGSSSSSSGGGAASTASMRARDDANPMLAANELLQGIQASGLVGQQHMAYLAAVQGLIYAANTEPGKQMGAGVANYVGGAWKRLQDVWSGKPGSATNAQDDPYWGMAKDEAYQARLRDMKQSLRNRHLATVQYRRALDADTSDYRFLYAAHYPIHAGDQARALLWKLAAAATACVLTKDNCWARSRARHTMDGARGGVMLLLMLLLLRSLHAHRPFFDPTANMAALLARCWLAVCAVAALPLFLMRDPLASAHTGLCVALLVGGVVLVLWLVSLAAGAMPRVSIVLRSGLGLGGRAPALTLSPGVLVARSAYDPRLRRLLIERVWQDTWSAILLASRDFRLLPNHRICFCRTRAHPPYMVNYIGFAAERHLENLHLYDAIGRHAYAQAVLWERQHADRAALAQQLAQTHTGPDMYFNPYAGGAGGSDAGAGAGAALDSAGARFRVGPRDVRSWFGKVYILHFPFMVCMVYDDLPDAIVPIADAADLQLFLAQNADAAVREKRDARRRLRALDSQYVTLTYFEHSGPGGAHVRYNLPLYAEENEQYLAQFAGRRRVLYRGVLRIRQHGTQQFGVCNVAPGFECVLQLTDEAYVDNEDDVNNLDRTQNAFRMRFWRTGVAGSAPRSGITQTSRTTLRLNDHNRHLLGVTATFDITPDLRALLDENADTVDARLPEVTDSLAQYQAQCFAEFARKRSGLTPSFHIDVFAPGPESYHVTHRLASPADPASVPADPASGSAVPVPPAGFAALDDAPSDTLQQQQQQQAQPPMAPATPLPAGGPAALAGPLWHSDAHGRLSCLPTLAQLSDRLERFEENPYMRNLLVDHRDDITLLYERLRTLVPSESNDPAKFAWYLFWDDIYRRYGAQVREFKMHDADFNPLYPNSLPYFPLPRARLERFLFERGLWKPIRSSKRQAMLAMAGGPAATASQRLPYQVSVRHEDANGGGGVFSRIASWFSGAENGRNAGALGGRRYASANEYAMALVPAPDYIPGVTNTVDGAQLWRAGDDDDYHLLGAHHSSAYPPAGAEASGFIHSGLLNRLYVWLDVIVYGDSH